MQRECKLSPCLNFNVFFIPQVAANPSSASICCTEGTVEKHILSQCQHCWLWQSYKDSVLNTVSLLTGLQHCSPVTAKHHKMSLCSKNTLKLELFACITFLNFVMDQFLRSTKYFCSFQFMSSRSHLMHLHTGNELCKIATLPTGDFNYSWSF